MRIVLDRHTALEDRHTTLITRINTHQRWIDFGSSRRLQVTQDRQWWTGTMYSLVRSFARTAARHERKVRVKRPSTACDQESAHRTPTWPTTESPTRAWRVRRSSHVMSRAGARPALPAESVVLTCFSYVQFAAAAPPPVKPLPTEKLQLRVRIAGKCECVWRRAAAGCVAGGRECFAKPSRSCNI